MADDRDSLPTAILYEETGRVLSQFWGWRHKVISLSGAMITTILAIAAWMYERRLGGAVAIPFVFGGFIAYGCWIFDRRNAAIINDCFLTGKRIEDGDGDGTAPRGIYGTIYANKRSAEEERKTYTQILARGYIGLAGLLVLCAIVIVVLAIVDPSAVTPR